MCDHSKVKRKGQNWKPKSNKATKAKEVKSKENKVQLLHYGPPPFKVLRAKCLSKAKKDLEK